MPFSTRRARRPPTRRASPVGANIPKLDAADKVTGRALYLDDLHVPGCLHGRTVRSTVPRGRILAVELDPAFDWRGVTVCDHRDIPGENRVALIVDDQPLLAADVIRHADEPVLLLAHENPERAEAAMRAVRVVVEPLPAVLGIADALAADIVIHGDDNVMKRIAIEKGDVETALAAADLIVEGTYRCGHQEQLYIENNAMLAERTADGGILLRGSLQCPYYVHKAIVRAFGLPPEKVRIVQTVTGGGFGGKEDYPSVIGGHAALLAWKSGRPVKLVYDRLEDIAATTKRHPAEVRIRAGVRRDGTLLAWDADVVMDGGAYVTLSPVVLSRGAIHAGGPYRCEHVRIRARAVATNTPPNGAFRGFGAPQTQFASECHMTRIAAALGLDPVALRQRNALELGDVTATGQTLRESVGTRDVIDRTARACDWGRRRASIDAANARAAAAERSGRAAHGGRRLRRGLGFASVFHGAGFTGSGEDKLQSVAALELAPDGRPRVLAANTEIGQGTVTVFAQIVAETLGIDPGDVLVQEPDTDRVPDSGPTVASRTCMVVGGLLHACALDLRARIEAFGGRAAKDGADFRRLARRYLERHGALRVEQKYRRPAGLVWDEDRYAGDAYGVFSYAALAVEVEVDLDTFEAQPVRVWTSHDIGTAIHPVLAAGQIEGGVVQGLGWALLEDVRWRDGRVWNHQLTNYIIPTAMDVPPIEVDIVENPYSNGPFGAKGVGELPMDVPAPAVIGAIAHATGVWLEAIPALPERLAVAASEAGR